MPLSENITLLTNEFHGSLLPETLQIIIYLSPIALMILLAWVFWNLWMRYIRGKFYNSLEYSVLELKLPKETMKSPLAMEVVLGAIHNTADGGYVARLWRGEYRPYYSLELVSIEGQVKFFIWTESRRKGGLMSALYSQYPGIEIYEHEDYTHGVHYDAKTMKIWAAEFVFTEKNPALPIKTYVDYGLDKDPKEELKVDPLSYYIEHLSSVPLNQQNWMQIGIRAHKKEKRKHGHIFTKHDPYKDAADKLINELMGRDAKTRLPSTKTEEGRFVPIKTSTVEDEVLKALQRSLSKLPFDAVIRTIYIAPRDQFNTPFGIGGNISGMKQFSTPHLNGLKPNGDKWIHQLGEPWQDYKDIRRNQLSKKVLEAYKLRSFFYPPFETEAMVMNAEELATIYHLPGSVAASPGLERVPSKKAEAPSNLPL
ncbi:MAG: hypothetical protein V4481_00845 [Patescibacteria group bacterium]